MLSSSLFTLEVEGNNLEVIPIEQPFQIYQDSVEQSFGRSTLFFRNIAEESVGNCSFIGYNGTNLQIESETGIITMNDRSELGS